MHAQRRAGARSASSTPTTPPRRGIGDGDEVDVYNELGRISCTAKVTEAVPPGTVAVPFGRWRSDRTGGGANSLTSDLLGDLAHGPTFCDNLVEVELVAAASPDAR